MGKCCATCKYWSRDIDRSRYADRPLKTGACYMKEIGEGYDEDLNDSWPICEHTDENHVCDDHEFEETITVSNEIVNPDFRNYIIPQRTVSKEE